MARKSKAAERAVAYKIDDAIDAARLAAIQAEEKDLPLAAEISITRLMLERAINLKAGGPAAEKLTHSIAQLRKQQTQLMREKALLVDRTEVFGILAEVCELIGYELYTHFNGGEPPRDPREPIPGYPMEIEIEPGMFATRSAPPDPVWLKSFDRILEKVADLMSQRAAELGA
jgi:hypothetical protein